MGIIGAHTIIYSKSADADRAFLHDVLGFRGIDVGGGWMIYGLPPGEVAVHPSDDNDVHELYLMVDDLAGFCAEMDTRGVAYSEPTMQPWGALTNLSLPSGSKLGVYQPRHARPDPMKVRTVAAAKPAATAKRSAAKKPVAKRPVAKKPAAKKPLAKKPAPRKPAAKKKR